MNTWTRVSGVEDKRMREKKKCIACGACTELVQGICGKMVSRYPAGQVVQRRDLEKQIDSEVEKKGSLCWQNDKLQVKRWSGGAGDCQIKD